MKKSRLFLLFEHLSPTERRALKKFVRSPYHNARQDAILLYDYILLNYRKSALLDKLLVYEQCYPGEAYNDAKLRQVQAHLSGLIEQFLAVDDLLQNDIKVKLATTKSLTDRKLNGMAAQSLEKAEDLWSKSNYRNRAYFETNYQILSEQHRLHAGEKRNRELDMNPLNEALEVSFIIEKLTRSCYMLSHQTIVNTNHILGLTNSIIEYVEKENLLRVPTVKIYYAAYHCLLPDAEEHWFYDIRDQLSSYGHLFPKEDLLYLFSVPINYAVKKINQGIEQYIKEIFNLYKFGLEHELFIQNGEISRFTYKNVITTSIKLGEFDWADQFIHNYKDFLPENYQDSYYRYNLANLCYARKEFDAAMKLLILLEFDDLFLNLDARALLLKIYFETQEWEALDSLLSSFKTFLYRNKVMGYHKDNYLNIIDLTRRLTTIAPHNKSDIDKTYKLLEKKQPNTEKKWMLDRLRIINE